ncbi:hypothetical protein MKX01_032902, partial [Papaver californicum]
MHNHLHLLYLNLTANSKTHSYYGHHQKQSSSTSHKYNGQQQPGYLSSGYGYGLGGYPSAPPPASIYGGVSFPRGTNPEIIRSFHTVDKDRKALSFGYQKFSLRTFRLLMFLPNVFAALWSCILLI